MATANYTIPGTDRTFYLNDEYLGDMTRAEKYSWDEGDQFGYNPAHHILTITDSQSGITQQFDWWGSIADPTADDEYTLRYILHAIASTAWDYDYCDVDDLLDPNWSYSRATQFMESLREERDLFMEFGLTDDELLAIVNDEEIQ